MECRICYDKTSEPLIEPCKCSGSMGFVHKSCLQTWINHKKSYICPVCNDKFNIERDNTQEIVSFLLGSDTVTTIITGVLCVLLLNISVYYQIRPNTIAVFFFMIVFGMYYIQNLFGHEEISFDVLFDTMLIHSTHNSVQFGHFTMIIAGLWVIIDKSKHYLLSPYA